MLLDFELFGVFSKCGTSILARGARLTLLVEAALKVLCLLA